MKPPPFAYHAPTDVGEALSLLEQYGDEAKVLAGGQSLMPMLNFRLAAPEHLVDINRLPRLAAVGRTPTGWRIPALVRQRTAEQSLALAASVPLLAAGLRHVGHPQIRNQGTVCGSLAHADPAAELPAVSLALDATMTVASHSGTRQVPAEKFFEFHLTTCMAPEEFLLDLTFEVPPEGTISSFQEFARRRGDFCLAAIAASLTFGPTDHVSRCRMVAAGVAPTPVRIHAAERLLDGKRLDDDLLAEAQATVRRDVNPFGDIHAGAGYRRHLVGVLADRALRDIRAQRGTHHV